MEFVQEPVHDRGEHHAHAGNEGHAAEQRVERGEPLPGIGKQFDDGPHAGENHGGVDQRIEPLKPSKKMMNSLANTWKLSKYFLKNLSSAFVIRIKSIGKH